MQKDIMNDRIFVFQNVPIEYVAKYKLSQAANNFCDKIVQLNCFSSYLSVPPSSVDHTFKSFYDKKTHIKYHVVRLFTHKRFGKFFNCLLDNLWIYQKILFSKEQKVWWYNVYSGNVVAFILVRFFSLKKNFILIADYNPDRYNFILRKILLNNIHSARGVLSLSARCSDLNQNFISIAGILLGNKIQRVNTSPTVNNRFLLSGTLNKNTGLDLAVKAFKCIPKAELILTGFMGESEKSWIKSVMINYPNIRYVGFISNYSEYLKLLSSIGVVLSLRNPSVEVNRYNFPSKILETLGYGIPIISTIEYPELSGVNYIHSDYDERDLCKIIEDIISGKMYAEMNKCQNNANILRAKFSEKAWIQAFDKIELNSLQ